MAPPSQELSPPANPVRFRNWRKTNARLMLSEMKRLRQVEKENARLSRIVAHLSLDKERLRESSNEPKVRASETFRPAGQRSMVDRATGK